MPEITTASVRIRFPMEGFEEAQARMVQMTNDFGAFWDRVEREAMQAEETVKRSISNMVAGLSATVRVGFDVLDVFGVTIDTIHKATVNLMLSYATQLALIATSTSVINPIYAGILATAAAALQARAIQLQAEGAADAKAALDKSRRLMTDLTTSLVILTRRT